MKNVYKFVEYDIEDLENYSNSKAYKIMDKLNNGIDLSRDEKTGGIFDELYYYDTYHTGIYKLMGYMFDFRPYMKKYLVNVKYSGWVEMYNFDKTSVRKNAAIPSWILKIIEL